MKGAGEDCLRAVQGAARKSSFRCLGTYFVIGCMEALQVNRDAINSAMVLKKLIVYYSCNSIEKNLAEQRVGMNKKFYRQSVIAGRGLNYDLFRDSAFLL